MELVLMNKKAIALMSGGLDSTLAVRLIVEQGIDVVALNFKSPFCLCDGSNSDGCKTHAMKAAGETGIEIKTIHKGLEYLEVLRNPKFGYGSAVNPCVDCRIFTFKSAKKYMEETGASFIITGEVLGQRPMSQRRDPMFTIEREAGLEGLILRPLSAKLLPPTKPEIEGIVDREKLLGIQGRSRKEQIQIADDFKIEDYPCASGGCLLTDKKFGAKLKDSFAHKDELGWGDIKMLTLGRHFRLRDDAAAVVGRNEDENRRIAVIGKKGMLLSPDGFKGPTVYLDGACDDELLELAGRLMLKFSKADGKTEYTISYQSDDKTGTFTATDPLPEEEVDRMWLR
jgi:tRNA U34 2-thiouridine synthase MnmA/TrmU